LLHSSHSIAFCIQYYTQLLFYTKKMCCVEIALPLHRSCVCRVCVPNSTRKIVHGKGT
jgi:hypothetical protein